MSQTPTRNVTGLTLLSGAALQLVFLVVSMVTSFFLPSQYNMQPGWPSYLIAVFLLGIATVGFYQIRTPQEKQRIDLPLGLTLGTVSAILLSIPGLGMSLAWATLGLPWLVVGLVQAPASLASVSPLFALVSAALYVAFATVYSVCTFQVARRSGSVKQGMQSAGVAVMATFLSTTLVFSFIYVIAYSLLQKTSGLVGPSSIPEVSPLVNFIASYQGVVNAMTTWLLVPVALGLLIALITGFLSRHSNPRPSLAVAD